MHARNTFCRRVALDNRFHPFVSRDKRLLSVRKRNFWVHSENAYASSDAQDGVRSFKKTFQDETTIRYASQRNEDPPNATHTKTQKQKFRLFMFRALNDGAVIAFLMIFRSRLQRRNTSLAAAFFRVCVSSEHTKIISVDLFFVHQHFLP